MAWDFETEPEFEEQLAWMRAFIDRELIPLEPIFDELPADEWQCGQDPPAGPGQGARAVGRLPRPEARRRRVRASSSWR